MAVRTVSRRTQFPCKDALRLAEPRLSMDTWVASCFWLLKKKIKLLWTFLHKPCVDVCFPLSRRTRGWTVWKGCV